MQRLARSAASLGLFRAATPSPYLVTATRIMECSPNKPKFHSFQIPTHRLLSTSRTFFCNPAAQDNIPPSYSSPLSPQEKPTLPEPPSTSADGPVSVDGAPTIEELDFVLPERPLSLDQLPDGILGEPAFDTLGLASWWPAGRLINWNSIPRFFSGTRTGTFFQDQCFPVPLPVLFFGTNF